MLRRGYEKSAHLYDIFDAKDNIDFFAHYASDAGEILDVGAGTGRIAVPMPEKRRKLSGRATAIPERRFSSERG